LSRRSSGFFEGALSAVPFRRDGAKRHRSTWSRKNGSRGTRMRDTGGGARASVS
jgi:hypothetical protein